MSIPIPLITNLGDNDDIARLSIFRFQVLCILDSEGEAKSSEIANILGMDTDMVTCKIGNWLFHGKKEGRVEYIQGVRPPREQCLGQGRGQFKRWSLTDAGKRLIEEIKDGIVVVEK